MKIQTVTAIVFWGLFGLLMGYDLWAVIKYGLPGTVTYHWWTLGASHTILCLVFGIFTGHLFKTHSKFLVLGLLALVLGFPVYTWVQVGDFHQMLKVISVDMFYAFLVGNLVALVFWTETDYGPGTHTE